MNQQEQHRDPAYQDRRGILRTQDTSNTTIMRVISREEVIDKYQRSSRATNRKLQEHFLTFKERIRLKQIEDFDQQYELKGVLGSGAYSTVYEGKQVRSGMPCAVKCIEKSSFVEGDERRIQLNQSEFEIVEAIHHPHITRSFELMEDSQRFYIVSELVTGGNLIDLMKSTKNVRLDEETAASIVKQILLALSFLHSQNIIHRDLKLENVLYQPDRAHPAGLIVKLTDFGFATCYDPTSK